MNKKLLAALITLACGSAAQAQSNVTVYGLVDAGLVRESGGPVGDLTKVTSGVSNGSRLGFRGVEELGDGLSVKYVLEMGALIDTGASAQGGLAFGRQSWVGLDGKYGMLSIGRQYTPLFLALNTIDPFSGVSMAGTAANLFSEGGIRMNNTVKYALANYKGFNADLSYGAGEAAGNSQAGRQLGAMLGYTAGPLNLKLAYHHANSNPAAPASPMSSKTTLLGATYDFGVVKLAAAAALNKGLVAIGGQLQNDTRDVLLGVTVPYGQHKFMLSALRKTDRGGTGHDARQWGIGYEYAMSKRTVLYAAYAHIDNSVAAGNAGFYTVGNACEVGSGNAAYNLGMRHSF
jgi:predicted porin